MDFTNNTKPIYLQIVDRLCDQAMSGTYAPGQRIPSVREYATDVQVNANTVMRAYDFLSSHDVIFNKRGIGYFLSDDAPAAINRLRAETFFSDEINYFFSRLQGMEVTPEKLSSLYQNFLNSEAK